MLTSIVDADCLPKHMYKVILNCAEEKLHDKSSYVTKSAIQLIKILIKLNPYSCDVIIILITCLNKSMLKQYMCIVFRKQLAK